MKKVYLTIAILLVSVICISAFAACGTTVGLSAYDIAVKNGFNGTEKEWLASLKGSDSGKSAYEIAVEAGFEGSPAEWLESLKGKDGKPGANGTNGTDGKDAVSPTVDEIYQAWLDKGNSGSFNDFIDEYMDVELKESSETAISKALLSSVSIVATFVKTEQVYVSDGSSWFGGGTYEDKDTEYSSAGSGVIYKLNKETGDAYIITNYHVVFDINSKAENHVSQNIGIYLYGQERSDYKIPATYVGGALNYDIAVLKVTENELLKNSAAVQVTVADSNELVVGQTTIAIGNPEADGLSVTKGVLSVDSEYMQMTGADGKTVVSLRSLRIDAPVNEGNSGGGLYNDKGELIGIVNAKIIENKVESIGYAIPSNIARYVADNILYNCDGVTSFKPKKCLLGITVELTDSKAVYDEVNKVTRIVETSKVKEIGANSIIKDDVQIGDVLKSLKIGDETIKITRQFIVIDAMLNVRPGDELELTVERDGETVVIKTIATETCMDIIE